MSRLRYYLVMALLPFSVHGWAQQIPVQHYSSRDGLPNDNVRVVYQDSAGYLWIGTTEGLSRYDGASFQRFSRSDGLADDFINQITEDRNGHLWVATNYGGISKWSGGRFQSYLPNPRVPDALENRVNVIFHHATGEIWIGTDGGLFYFEEQRFIPIRDEEGFLKDAVTAIHRDTRGALWIGTVNGLARVGPGSDTHSASTQPALRGQDIYAVAEDDSGMLWIGTDDGLFTITTDSENFDTILIPGTRLARIRSLLFDREGVLWIGTSGHGVHRYGAHGSHSTYTVENGLAGNNVADLYEDREDNLWLATSVGLDKITHRHALRYTVVDGLADHPVIAVGQDESGDIWFGTKLGLSRMHNGRFSTFTKAEGLPSDYVLYVLTARDGSLWIGTTIGIAHATGGRNPRFRRYGQTEGWSCGRARVIYEDAEARIWFGGDGCVGVLDNGKILSFSLPPGFDRTLVTGLARDYSGFLWVGLHDGGLLRLPIRQSEGSIQPVADHALHVPQGDVLSDGHIRCALLDRKGNLWIGTRFGGAVRITPGSGTGDPVLNHTTVAGLENMFIRALFEDRQGRIWAATGKGVGLASESDSGLLRFVRIGEVPEDETFAVFEDDAGRLWVGTAMGVLRLNALVDSGAETAPPVVIRKFDVAGIAYPGVLPDEPVRLRHTQRSVAFEFTGLSFQDGKRLRYQYMLEGLDTGWNPPTDRRYITYTNLPYGSYMFKVRASHDGDTWPEQSSQVAFHIAAPFWVSRWFIAALVFVLLVSANLAYRFRLQRRLDVERVRLKIAADLHDEIGSTLGGISVFSEVAMADMDGLSPRTRTLLKRIGESSRSALETMDDVVWAINPQNDDLGSVIRKMREYAVSLFEAQGIDFEIRMPETNHDIKLSMNARKNLYLIYKEAVCNLIRHSGCSKAGIVLSIEHQVLHLKIWDNGVGIDASTALSGNGIENMKRRASEVGGSLRLDSGNGTGTLLSLRLQIT